MTLPPRMHLYYHQGWSGVANLADVPRVSALHIGSADALIAGLRGYGQAISGNHIQCYPSGQWNTFGVLFDQRLTNAIGSNDLIVRLRGTPGWDVLIYRYTTGVLRVVNNNTSENVFTTRVLATGLIHKFEILVYLGGVRNGVRRSYWKLLIDGKVWLEQNESSMFIGADGSFGNVVFDNANQDMGSFAVFVGQGGFTDGDIRSDSVGNPQVVPCFVDGGAPPTYNDATPTGAFSNPAAVDELLSDTGTYSTLPASPQSARQSYVLLPLPTTVTRILGVSGEFYIRNSADVNPGGPLFLRINPAADEYREGYYHRAYGSYATVRAAFGGYDWALWRKSPATGREITLDEVNGAGTGAPAELGWGPLFPNGTNDVSHVYAEALVYIDPPAAPTPPVAQKSLAIHKTHHLCRLYRLWPRWGPPMYFTNHDSPIMFRDTPFSILGNRFEPAGGISATDQRRELGLKDADLDIRGAITSTKITTEELRAGRYRNATLTEFVVDYKKPWAGSLRTKTFTIEPDEIDSEVWLAKASGMTQRLAERAGDAYYPRCRFHLFDNDYPNTATRPTWERGCKLEAMGFARAGFVGVVTDRRVFQITDIGSPAANYYAGGLITWVIGNNQSIVGEIKSHSGGIFSLHLPMPFDVVQLETVMIWPGCNFLIGTVNAGDCEDKYDNVKNFGGFMLIPGTDEAMRGASS